MEYLLKDLFSIKINFCNSKNKLVKTHKKLKKVILEPYTQSKNIHKTLFINLFKLNFFILNIYTNKFKNS